MALQEITMPFPQIREYPLDSDFAEFKLGKVTWVEDKNAPLLGVETIEDSIKAYAKMWCIKNGIETWSELLGMPSALQQFKDHMATIRVHE